MGIGKPVLVTDSAETQLFRRTRAFASTPALPNGSA